MELTQYFVWKERSCYSCVLLENVHGPESLWSDPKSHFNAPNTWHKYLKLHIRMKSSNNQILKYFVAFCLHTFSYLKHFILIYFLLKSDSVYFCIMVSIQITEPCKVHTRLFVVLNQNCSICSLNWEWKGHKQRRHGLKVKECERSYFISSS
jgi:hypothetical protein